MGAAVSEQSDQEIAALEQVLGAIEHAKRRSQVAWRLINELDGALERITSMQDMRKAQRLDRRMRSAIKAALVQQ